MPICKKCNSQFPNTMQIDGKMRNLQRRKYCLLCSPFNKHNTSKIHTIQKDGEYTICKNCGRKYIYDHKKGHSRHRCNSCVVNHRRFGIKKKAIKYKGGKCEICGYDRCVEAMEFHHLDPSEKEFSLSGSHCKSWDTIKKELDKCKMLCCRCHREYHSGLIEDY